MVVCSAHVCIVLSLVCFSSMSHLTNNDEGVTRMFHISTSPPGPKRSSSPDLRCGSPKVVYRSRLQRPSARSPAPGGRPAHLITLQHAFAYLSQYRWGQLFDNIKSSIIIAPDASSSNRHATRRSPTPPSSHQPVQAPTPHRQGLSEPKLPLLGEAAGDERTACQGDGGRGGQEVVEVRGAHLQR